MNSKTFLKMGGAFDGTLGEGIQTPELFGPYVVGNRDAVMNLIVRDLYDASGEGGVRPLPALRMDWS